MHGFLWFLQVALAVVFAAVGWFLLTQPREALQRMMPWVEDYSYRRVQQIGGAQVAAAVGLVLPAATGILPWLTPLAAAGLLVLMALAAETHYRRRELALLPVTVVLGLLAGLVAVFRFGPYSW
jgi:hypothetical protein